VGSIPIARSTFVSPPNPETKSAQTLAISAFRAFWRLSLLNWLEAKLFQAAIQHSNFGWLTINHKNRN